MSRLPKGPRQRAKKLQYYSELMGKEFLEIDAAMKQQTSPVAPKSKYNYNSPSPSPEAWEEASIESQKRILARHS